MSCPECGDGACYVPGAYLAGASPVPTLVPIDHITVSKHWGVLPNTRGPDIGSDPFPVEATVYLK
jgi:endonuclease/exonuclease/phosphatase (EEP) superfamily protein YafD